MVKAGMFYVYQDRYGWAVATVTGAPFEAFKVAHDGPRSFESEKAARDWIAAAVEVA